jgi:hypothetical protein
MCVAHLGDYLGPGRLRALSSAVMADLGGEASPASGVLGANGSTAIHTSAKRPGRRAGAYRALETGGAPV